MIRRTLRLEFLAGGMSVFMAVVALVALGTSLAFVTSHGLSISQLSAFGWLVGLFELSSLILLAPSMVIVFFLCTDQFNLAEAWLDWQLRVPRTVRLVMSLGAPSMREVYLAICYALQGRLAEADHLFQTAMKDVRKNAFTANLYGGIFSIYYRQTMLGNERDREPAEQQKLSKNFNALEYYYCATSAVFLFCAVFVLAASDMWTSIMYEQSTPIYQLRTYTREIGRRTNNAQAYYHRGDAYDELGQYQRAIEDYTQAITLDSKYAEAYNQRGNSYFHKEQFQEAIEDYSKAISLRPLDTQIYWIYVNRANTFQRLGKVQQAIDDYSTAIRLAPKDVQLVICEPDPV